MQDMKFKLSFIFPVAALMAVLAAGALTAQETFTEESEYSFAQELFVDSNYRLAENVFKSI
jgi:hypothetical protein